MARRRRPDEPHAPRTALELWQRVREHSDRDAFEELVRRFGARVVEIAHRILRDPARAQEIAQDALWTIWVLRKEVKGLAYAYKVAENKALAELKRQKREQAAHAGLLIHEILGVAGSGEAEARFWALVSGPDSSLTALERALVEMKLDGLSWEAIAGAFGEPVHVTRYRFSKLAPVLRRAISGDVRKGV